VKRLQVTLSDAVFARICLTTSSESDTHVRYPVPKRFAACRP
jgi:hypothetical protein